MPTVADILMRKGDFVHAIAPETSVLDAIHKMNQLKIGSLVVMENGFVVGMFTERDVLRLVGDELNPAEAQVKDAMSTNVKYAKPEMQLDDVGEIMKDRRIRHLPVCDEMGRLKGVISIGDLNAYHVQHQEQTIQGLNDYIYGRA
jgi:CBS domain-containing protein